MGRGGYNRGGSSEADERPGGGFGGYGAMQPGMYGHPGMQGAMAAGMMPQVCVGWVG